MFVRTEHRSFALRPLLVLDITLNDLHAHRPRMKHYLATNNTTATGEEEREKERKKDKKKIRDCNIEKYEVRFSRKNKKTEGRKRN